MRESVVEKERCDYEPYTGKMNYPEQDEMGWIGD